MCYYEGPLEITTNHIYVGFVRKQFQNMFDGSIRRKMARKTAQRFLHRMCKDVSVMARFASVAVDGPFSSKGRRITIREDMPIISSNTPLTGRRVQFKGERFPPFFNNLLVVLAFVFSRAARSDLA